MGDKVSISDAARELSEMRAAFEKAVNGHGNLYNLTPMAAGGDSKDVYWSVHTERAWLVFQLGWYAAKGAYHGQ